MKKYWLPVILWMALIFILSSIPGKNIPDIPIPNFHKLVHLIEYSVLGALLIRALIHLAAGTGKVKLILISIAIAAAFALSDEWHQTFVPGRNGCLMDAINDIIYAMIGVYVYYRASRGIKLNTNARGVFNFKRIIRR